MVNLGVAVTGADDTQNGKGKAYGKGGVGKVDADAGENVNGASVEGGAVGGASVDGNVPKFVAHLKGLHLTLDGAIWSDEAGHATVGATKEGAAVFNATEDGHYHVLALGRFGTGPRVVGHVDDKVSTILDKFGTEVAENVLVTDGCRKFDTVGGFEDNRFGAFFPPVVVIGFKEVVEPRKLFFVGKVLGKGDEVLLEVGLLDGVVIKQDNGVVIQFVPVAVFVIGW